MGLSRALPQFYAMDPKEKINKEMAAGKDGDTLSVLEIKRVQEAMNRTDTEKFHLFCRMVCIQIMLDNAVITHKEL